MKLPPGVDVRVGYPFWLRLLLMRNVAAITIGRRIWIAHDLAPAELAALLRHELVHVRQMGERGVIFFFLRYAAEYVANRCRRMGHDAAYRAISFEREAFEAERAPARPAA